jgi:hypothetical protein
MTSKSINSVTESQGFVHSERTLGPNNNKQLPALAGGAQVRGRVTGANLTDTLADKLKASGIHWDRTIKRFGLRVTANRTKAWVLDYDAGGRRRRINLGTSPS